MESAKPHLEVVGRLVIGHLVVGDVESRGEDERADVGLESRFSMNRVTPSDPAGEGAQGLHT